MEHETSEARAQRRIVEAAVIGSAVVVWRPAHEVFNIPKLTFVVLAALGVALVGLRRVLATGELRIPRTIGSLAVVPFVLVAGVSVASSDAGWRSFFGTYGRANGFVLYLGAAVLFFGVLASVTAGSARRVARAIVIGGAIVALYGLSQRVGVDPFDWSVPYGPRTITSTLGNPNFVSGYLAVILPVAVWGAVSWRDRMRKVAIAAVALLAVTIFATRSQQGVLAAGAGLAVLGLVIAVERGGRLRARLVGGIVLAGLLAGLGVLLGLAGSGPLRSLNDTGYGYRREYWSAAVEVGTDDPLTGVGFSRFAAHYREARSAEAAAATILTDTADDPHSVPLNMFAGGGFPLLAAYLAFVGAVGSQFVVGLRRTRGDERLLLGGVGAAWLAYQVQSAVSIDVPPLPVVHFVLAGLIVALATQKRLVTVRVPFLIKDVQRRVSRKVVSTRSQPRVPAWLATTLAVALGLVGTWQLTRPLRADMEMRRARSGAAVGIGDQWVDSVKRVFDLSPKEPEYLSLVAGIFARRQQAVVALPYYERAVALEPRRFEDVLNAARLAAAADDPEKGLKYYEEAIALEPHSPDLRIEYATFLADAGLGSDAIDVLEAALEQRPDDAEAWMTFGDVLADTDADRSLDAYRTALRVADPTLVTLRADLASRFRTAGALDDARAAIDEALTQVPHSLRAHYEAALIDEATGDLDAAIEHYRFILGYDPTTYPEIPDRLAADEAGAPLEPPEEIDG